MVETTILKNNYAFLLPKFLVISVPENAIEPCKKSGNYNSKALKCSGENLGNLSWEIRFSKILLK